MATKRKVNLQRWLDNCCSFRIPGDLKLLKQGLADGYLNEQDEYGSTVLTAAVVFGWLEGVETLLTAGANTELRYYRTGETALHLAVQGKNEAIIEALIQSGANPDAANYWGLTPRKWNKEPFAHIKVKKLDIPPPYIQNAEHLADHHYPRFKIPSRKERESLQPGQAVDLYVYGPKSKKKHDSFKVRITQRKGRGAKVQFTASLETPIAETHLLPGTTAVTFGPEHVATVYRSTKKR